MAYLPLENYGAIGDMRTLALVGDQGSIDWWCAPRFDSPSVFGALLDDAKGGFFRIAPEVEGTARRQIYFPDTNVLLTRFLSPEGMVELTDFMNVAEGPRRIIRRVAVVRGKVGMKAECVPAFDYARARHETEIRTGGAIFRGPGISLGLATRIPLRCEGEGVTGRFVLEEGQSVTFILGMDECTECFTEDMAERAFRETVDFWRRWIGRSRYRGRWREMVHRSALALKLLTYVPTGAIVAAPTCGLPGGELNRDRRYTWIRDASFTLHALMRIGFTEEARSFMQWLNARAHDDGLLRSASPVEGTGDLEVQTLTHLKGYRDSGPVRIGEDIRERLHHDIYGALMDAVYLFNKYGEPIGYDLWVHLRRMLDRVAEEWTDPDDGIWETGGGRARFLYSRVMSWVALDRGLRLAAKRSFPADRDRWRGARDAITGEVMERGWSERRQAFVQAYEREQLDAAALVLPLVRFVSPSDPRMLSTIEAVMRNLRSGGLVYRCEEDRGGTFTPCSFWLVEALTRAGQLDEARLLFEKVLSYASPLGLYSEGIGSCGEALGNMPRALTHLSLISAACNLDEALEARRRRRP